MTDQQPPSSFTQTVSPSLQGPREAVKPQGGSHVYLVTGGTGFLGSSVAKHLLSLGHRVRVYARSEHGHEALVRGIPEDQRPRLSTLLGAVEDSKRLRRAMRGVTHVIHAAAQKIIYFAEYDAGSCLSTNINGTRNVIEACLDAGVSRAVFVSTDKAAAPATLYGASKLCAERLWLGANRYSAGRGTEFVACRYGNVWGSKGSVLEAWRDQAARGEKIQLTNPRCTRFHITRADAVALVLKVLEEANPGELWIPKLRTYKLGELCVAFRTALGIKALPDISGLRLAEKLHESLISDSESMACVSKDSEKFILMPGTIRENGGWVYESSDPRDIISTAELMNDIESWRRGLL